MKIIFKFTEAKRIIMNTVGTKMGLLNINSYILLSFNKGKGKIAPVVF
jgi:hypothetical protein